MKKKILLAISLLSLSLALSACGNDKTKDNEVIDTIVDSGDAESSSNEVDDPIDESFGGVEGDEGFGGGFGGVEVIVDGWDYPSYLDYVSLDVIDGEFIATVKDDSFDWTISEIDNDLAEVIVGDGIFSVKPLVSGEIWFDIIGRKPDLEVFCYPTLFVDENMEIEIYSDGYVATPEDELFEIPMDEGTNSIMQEILTGLDGVLEIAHFSSMVDLDETYSVEWAIGAENVSLAGIEAIEVTEPMISSSALSIVVVRFDSNENASAAESSLHDNAPVRKWVCVAPEKVSVRVLDNYVIVVMANEKIVSAFDSIKF